MSDVNSLEKRHKIKLINIIKHDEEVYSFDFDGSDLNEWSEGDHCKLYVPYKDKEVFKKFSFTTLAEESIIRFTTRIKDERSRYKEILYQLNLGDQIEISTPSGDFKLKRHNRPIVLLSNGVGIAASRSLIKGFDISDDKIPLMIQINVDSKSSIFKEEFDTLMCKKHNFKSFYESHRKEYYQRLDYELQELMMTYEEDAYVYLVGSDSFIKDTISHLISVGFSNDDIITDSHVFSPTACDCGPETMCGCGGNLVQVLPFDQKQINELTV